MLQCGFVRSNFAFVMMSRPSWCFRLLTTGIYTGAGEGNRTLVVSLEGFCSTIELHPHGDSLQYRYSFNSGGGGWIRTSVGVSQQIYSLPPLATRAPLRRELTIMGEQHCCVKLSARSA